MVEVAEAVEAAEDVSPENAMIAAARDTRLRTAGRNNRRYPRNCAQQARTRAVPGNDH